MATSSYTKWSSVALDGRVPKIKVETEAKYLNSRKSPRGPDGRLKLQANAHTRIKRVIRVQEHWENPQLAYNLIAPQGPGDAFLRGSERAQILATNQAYARIRGKLYAGNAALGVTMGSYGQTKEMIITRYRQLNQRADHALARLGTSLTPKTVASTHLEVVFGWMPLLADIQASTTTVIQQAVPPVFVGTSAKWADQRTVRRRQANVEEIHLINTQGKVVLSAQVLVQNPNLWLAERAGSLNAAAVAWDLVPWSFVVNMFVNTGQIVNSFTDFAGLRFLNLSKTVNERFFDEIEARSWLSGPQHAGFARYTVFSHPKSRVLLTSLPQPTFQFKLPGPDIGLRAIAASLLTQKFSKLTRLMATINPFYKT